MELARYNEGIERPGLVSTGDASLGHSSQSHFLSSSFGAQSMVFCLHMPISTMLMEVDRTVTLMPQFLLWGV